MRKDNDCGRLGGPHGIRVLSNTSSRTYFEPLQRLRRTAAVTSDRPIVIPFSNEDKPTPESCDGLAGDRKTHAEYELISGMRNPVNKALTRWGVTSSQEAAKAIVPLYV